MELPEKFCDRVKRDLGVEAEDFFSSLKKESETSIRINKNKIKNTKLSDNVPWCNNGRYLSERPVFTADPLFNVGGYYVQEASSMFLEQAFSSFVDKNDEPVVIDLCASPGGKSTHLASLLDGHGLLISNEVVKNRVAPLRENLTKWGYNNIFVTNSDPSDFSDLEGFADVIVVDAPCSGEGMFRKDEQAISEWSEQNVEMCQSRQRDILSSIYNVLKDDGILIYSTCTYNSLEDEDNVRWICDNLGAEVLNVDIDKSWKISTSDYGYHFYQHKIRGEGFFLSVMRKNSQTDHLRFKQSKSFKFAKVPEVVKNWLNSNDEFAFIQKNDSIIAIPKKFSAHYEILNNTVRVVQSGTLIATVKGNDYIPSTDLALSSFVNNDAFKVVELDWCQAMAFLKREMLNLDESEKGWYIVTFEGVNLGFVKNLGTRVNVLYPAEWHVRMNVDQSMYKPII